MATTEKIVGLYGDPNAIAQNPGSLDQAQKEIGLNWIIFGGGFNLSQRTRMLNPSSGGFAPGLTLVDDDQPIRTAIEEAHKRGIQVWGCISLYWAGAEHAPDLMAYDLYGKRLDAYPLRAYAHEQGSMTYCPNNERINAWFEAALVEIARQYDFQGYALTHARYCHPAFFEQMLACGCPTCQKKAGELGYDFDKMKSAVLNTITKIKGLNPAKIKSALKSGFGFFDFIQMLGADGEGLVDWFNFRADGITLNIKRIGEAVHEVRPDFKFGSDSHYPTMALLVGQRYSDLVKICDQILPLLSHNEIHYMDNLGSMATILTQWIDGLQQAEAVKLVYRLFGINSAAMPKTIQEMHLGEPPSSEVKLEALEEIITAELYKARAFSGSSVPSYPVIKGTLWPELSVRNLMAAALEAGHDGIVLQGTDSLYK